MAKAGNKEAILGFRNPQGVVSPKNRWELGKVLCSTGQGGWAIAEGTWDKKSTLGIRWNGDDDTGSPGNPQSHGNPTWFILPEELHEAARGVAYRLNETMSFITVDITRPEGFEYGVFKVRISVEGAAQRIVEKNRVVFDIPVLPKRFFHPDLAFSEGPKSDGSPWRGKFKDGIWESVFQTNGIREEDNPTSLDIVKDALVASVSKSLKPWLDLTPPPAPGISNHPLGGSQS